MRATGLALILGLVAGCGAGDPETSRIPTGWEALAVDREADLGTQPRVIPLVVPQDPDPDRFRLYPPVDPGTRVLVLEDVEKGEDNPMRQVSVKVLDGELAGRTGKMMRWSLRPVR